MSSDFGLFAILYLLGFTITKNLLESVDENGSGSVACDNSKRQANLH